MGESPEGVLQMLLRRAGRLIGCGGGGEDEDPRSVARMITEAVAYRCGEEGGGRLYDLTLPSSREISREQALYLDTATGCQPQPIPDIDAVVVLECGDRVVVETSVRQPSGSLDTDRFVLMRTDDGWRYLPYTEPEEVK
jgi:hypothetical protein